MFARRSRSITRHWRRIFASTFSPRGASAPLPIKDLTNIPRNQRVGIIAGNGPLPIRFIEGAKKYGCEVYAIAHTDETEKVVESLADNVQWIKVGQLGAIIDYFLENKVDKVAMVGGINRIRLFGGVKLDFRGAAMLMRLGSMKDDVIMRGIAEELEVEGIEVISSVCFFQDHVATIGVLTESAPTKEEYRDIDVGIAALKAMSAQDIGQLVVVRDGVVVAVEAIEGSDKAIRRGGELGGPRTVVVKFAKATQDMRFDVPTIGIHTIHTLIEAKARVLAIEAGRCLLLDAPAVLELAEANDIVVVGCTPLVENSVVGAIQKTGSLQSENAENKSRGTSADQFELPY